MMYASDLITAICLSAWVFALFVWAEFLTGVQ